METQSNTGDWLWLCGIDPEAEERLKQHYQETSNLLKDLAFKFKMQVKEPNMFSTGWLNKLPENLVLATKENWPYEK